MRSAAAILGFAALAACAEAADPEAYKPATADYGRVNAVWFYEGGTRLKAEPGTKLIAADITLPPVEEKFDLAPGGAIHAARDDRTAGA